MHVLRGVESFPGMSGSVIYHVARCEKCRHVEPPSHAGEKCRCGGILEPLDADFVALDINDPSEARHCEKNRHHAAEDLCPLWR